MIRTVFPIIFPFRSNLLVASPNESCIWSFTVSGNWNERLLRENFAAQEAHCILSLPFNNIHAPDQFIWHFDKTDTFSINSGDMVAQNNFGTTGSSSSSLDIIMGWWKEVWKLSLPSKIKNFFWHLCLDQLPTCVTLIKRGLNISNFYVLCGCSGEDTLLCFLAL